MLKATAMVSSGSEEDESDAQDFCHSDQQK